MEHLNNYEIGSKSIKISLIEELASSESTFSNLELQNSDKVANNLSGNLDLMDTLENEFISKPLEIMNSAPSSMFQTYLNENNNSTKSPFNTLTSECILLSNVFDLIE